MRRFLSVAFADVNNGWAVGNGGTIFQTTNGGGNWSRQSCGTTNSLQGVAFVDANNGWIVGLNGTILHTSNGGAWVSDPQHALEIPSSITLSAYPNPFNAVTRLHFNLARTGRVDLQVFDLNGRLVETLASKTFNAGEHEIRFDGKNLATGVYLARMQSGSFSATQKLMLIK
jgi:hypothetical protein